MNEDTIDGWPAHTGPLRVLSELGNVLPGSTPEWVHEPTHGPTNQGAVFKCRSHRGLGPNAILDLAALAVEGYHVYILPRGRYARINIFETEGS